MPLLWGQDLDAGREDAAPVIQNPDAITAFLAAVHSNKWFIPATGPTGPPGHPAPHEPIAT